MADRARVAPGLAVAWLLLCAAPTARAQLWELEAEPRPASGAHFSFGADVACSGDVFLVGASAETNVEEQAGVAYVFGRDDLAEMGRLVPSAAAKYDALGAYVAIDGDTALLGTTRLERGSVRVFSRASGVWSEQQTLVPDPELHASNAGSFGRGVAVQGDVALVSAPLELESGAVFSFTRRDGQWVEDPQLIVASDAQPQDYFGLAIALDGDTAVVSAPGNGFFPTERSGVYVFRRSSAGWQQEARLSIEGEPVASPHVYFGGTIAIDGDTILVGASPSGETPGEGRAVVYTRSGASWTPQQTLTVPGVQWFGRPVQVQGDTALIGGTSVDGQSTLYEFTRAAGVWTQTQQLLVGTPGLGFFSMAVCGGTLVLGRFGNEEFPGGVFVYRNSALAESDPGGASGASGGSGGDAGGGCRLAAGRRASPSALLLLAASGIAWLFVRRRNRPRH